MFRSCEDNHCKDSRYSDRYDGYHADKCYERQTYIFMLNSGISSGGGPEAIGSETPDPSLT